jgi:diacylglycerol diphosphate phosphatase/phosphatidate phosphatase
MIAISRCEDYRHDVWDVTFGSLLGVAIAHFSYRRYYPSLRSPRCEIPYDKSDVALADGFSKLADDEERQEHRAQRSDPVSAGWESPEGPFRMDDVPPSESR